MGSHIYANFSYFKVLFCGLCLAFMTLLSLLSRVNSTRKGWGRNLRFDLLILLDLELHQMLISARIRAIVYTMYQSFVQIKQNRTLLLSFGLIAGLCLDLSKLGWRIFPDLVHFLTVSFLIQTEAQTVLIWAVDWFILNWGDFCFFWWHSDTFVSNLGFGRFLAVLDIV